MSIGMSRLRRNRARVGPNLPAPAPEPSASTYREREQEIIRSYERKLSELRQRLEAGGGAPSDEAARKRIEELEAEARGLRDELDKAHAKIEELMEPGSEAGGEPEGGSGDASDSESKSKKGGGKGKR